MRFRAIHFLNSVCHPEPVEDTLVPPGEHERGKTEMCVVLILFHFKQFTWDAGPTSEDNWRRYQKRTAFQSQKP